MGLLDCEKFLCCFELKTGAKIIGFSTLVLKAIMALIVSVVMIVSLAVYFGFKDADEDSSLIIAFSCKLDYESLKQMTLLIRSFSNYRCRINLLNLSCTWMHRECFADTFT